MRQSARIKLGLMLLTVGGAALAVDLFTRSEGSIENNLLRDVLQDGLDATATKALTGSLDASAPSYQMDIASLLGTLNTGPARDTPDVFGIASATGLTNGPNEPGTLPGLGVSMNGPRLSAILAGLKESLAVIDGRAMRIGQSHGGMKLLRIEADGAVVQVDGEEKRLEMRR